MVTFNKRFRRASISIRLGVVVAGAYFDWRVGLGALLMGAVSLIAWTVQNWKPKPPPYIFDLDLGRGEGVYEDRRPGAIFAPPRHPEDGKD